MTVRPGPAAAAALALCLAAACDNAAAQPEAGALPGEFTIHTPLFGPAPADLAGTYSGLLACGSVVTQSTLSIQPGTAGAFTGRYSQRTTGPRAGPADSFEHEIAGGYQAASGRLVITASGPADRFAARLPRTLGVVQADGSAILLLSRGGANASCSTHVLKRGEAPPAAWRDVLAAAEPASRSLLNAPIFRLPGKLMQLPQIFQRGCPDHLVRWVSQLQAHQAPGIGMSLQAQWILFSDAHFVPHFGKPLQQLSASERETQSNLLRSHCQASPEFQRAGGSALLGGVVEAFMELPGVSRAQILATHVGQDEIRSWQQKLIARAAAAGAAGAPPELLDMALQETASLTGMLWPSEQAAFQTQSAAARNDIGFASLKFLIAQGGTGTSAKIDRLERMAATFANLKRTHPQLSAAQSAELATALAAKMDQSAPEAAVELVGMLSAPVEADRIARWTETYPHLAAQLRGPARSAVQSTFTAGVQGIERKMAEQERTAMLATVAASEPATQKLKKLVAQELRAQTLFSPYMKGSDWQAHLQETASARSALLAQAQGDLLGQVQATGARAQLDALLAAHLAPGDAEREPGRAFMAAIQPKLMAVAPFAGIAGGEYFDAIHAGDFRTAAEFDRRIGQRMQDSTRDMVNSLLGKRPGTRGDAITEGFLSMSMGPGLSLAYPLASLFVLNYEPRYGKACMPGAVPITVSTTVVERGRDAFGWPYERNLGTTTQTVLVKPGLADMALSLRLQDPSVGAGLLEFLNKRATLGPADIVRGTRELMARFDCNSAPLATFERNLAVYLQQVQRR